MAKYFFYLCEDSIFVLNVIKLFAVPAHPRYREADNQERKRYNKLYKGRAVPLSSITTLEA